MEFLQGYFATALWALVFSCIIVKLVSSAVSGDGNRSAERRVVAIRGGDQVGAKGVREIAAESLDIDRVVDEDEDEREVVVEKLDEQCGDARDGSWAGGESRNIGLSEVGASKIDAFCGVEGKDVLGDVKVAGEVLVGVSKIDAFCGVEGKHFLGDVKVVREELKSEEVVKKNVVESNLPRDDVASGHIGVAGEELVGASKIDALCGVEGKDVLGDVKVAGEELVGASKMDTLCGVEGKDVLGDVKVVGEELQCEEVVKKNVVESNLPRDAAASGHIEGGFRQEDEKEMGDVSDDDDDWEGIERSDLEILFAKAINFVECGNSDALSNLGSELQMQLYALHKMAMEGPCYEPQPMAFKLSARAKWNAWQRMGSMSSEAAMEQYVKLLSDTVPGWIRCSSTESCVDSSSAIGKTRDADFNASSPDIQSDCTNEK